jgi:uncharacterized repeat protein (TIGR03803 family)
MSPNRAIYEGDDLYGTTGAGGTAGTPCGTVFKLGPPAKKGDSWTQIVLYNFVFSPDVGAPGPGLLYKDGNLYGTSS